jgi:hypothetical protein
MRRSTDALANSTLRAAVGTLCVITLLAVIGISTDAVGDTKHSGEALNCSECHKCEHPTEADPCLIPQTCPRHEAMRGIDPKLGPSIVILDELENLYVPVRFDHRAHAEMTKFGGDCEICHHFTPPESPHPACKQCHPSEIHFEDLTQPGLKGAYHRSCLGCHKDWDSDTACEICHERKVQGVASDVSEETFHSQYEPLEMTELIIYETEYDEGDKVPFQHKKHTTLYGISCADCHMEQSCEQCHVRVGEAHPMGDPAEVDLHGACFQCHDEENCEKCHGADPDAPFDHAATGWPLKSYHAELSCQKCHGEGNTNKSPSTQCEVCHRDGWPASFNHAVTGVELDELHMDFDCTDCHTEGYGKKPDCSSCHDDDRSYDKKTGFGQ